MHSGEVIYLNNKIFAQFAKLHIRAGALTGLQGGVGGGGRVVVVIELLCFRHCAESFTGMLSFFLILQVEGRGLVRLDNLPKATELSEAEASSASAAWRWNLCSALQWRRSIWAKQGSSLLRACRTKREVQVSKVSLTYGYSYLIIVCAWQILFWMNEESTNKCINKCILPSKTSKNMTMRSVL